MAGPEHFSGPDGKKFRCRLRNGEIIREQSKRWEPVVLLTGVSRISRLLTDAWLNILAARSIGYQRELTLELLARMKRISDDQDATLIILIQDVPPSYLDAYSDFFYRNKIIFIDGSAIAQRKELGLPDGHPGPEMARLWAHQIAERLSQF